MASVTYFKGNMGCLTVTKPECSPNGQYWILRVIWKFFTICAY